MSLPVSDYLTPFSGGGIGIDYTTGASDASDTALLKGAAQAYLVDGNTNSIQPPVILQARKNTLSVDIRAIGADATLTAFVQYAFIIEGDQISLNVEGLTDTDGNPIEVNFNSPVVTATRQNVDAGGVILTLPFDTYDFLSNYPGGALTLSATIFSMVSGGITLTSPLSVYRLEQNPLAWYVAGPRRHACAYLNQAGLTARDAKGKLLTVSWQYEGEDALVTAGMFNDPNPAKVLIVTNGTDAITLNPVNIAQPGAIDTYYSMSIGAVRNDGTVCTWGSDVGGNSDSGDVNSINHAQSIYFCKPGSAACYAALNSDNQAFIWGGVSKNYENITSISCSEVTSMLRNSDGTVTIGFIGQTIPGISDVIDMVGSGDAFAFRLTSGGVSSYGDESYGGDSSSVSAIQDIVQITGSRYAFAALRQTGNVVAWGDVRFGGDASSVAAYTDITMVVSSHKAFCVLRSNGSVAVWGGEAFGGYLPDTIAVRTDIVRIFGCGAGFAAQTETGEILVWGDNSILPPSDISQRTDIITLAGNNRAFAAIINSGGLITWGDSGYGGNLPDDIGKIRNFVAVYAGTDSFTALTSDNKVYTWGGEPAIPHLQPATVNGSVGYRR